MEKIFVDFFASDRQFFCCLWIVVALRCSLLNAILLMVMTSQTLDGGEAARRQKCVIKCEIKIAGIFLVAKFNIFAAVYTKQKKVSVARALVVLQIRASVRVCVCMSLRPQPRPHTRQWWHWLGNCLHIFFIFSLSENKKRHTWNK